MCRYITGFQTEQDVRLTLEAMEKKGWKWISGKKPTRWDGWRVNSSNYSNFYISYESSFGWSTLPKENTIYFMDAIRELTGSASVHPVTELPEYFTIPCNSNNKKNPLWEKYIDWLNKKYDAMNGGDSDSGFYGHHKNGDTYNHPYEMNGELEITLEEWESMVGNTSAEVELDTTTEVEIPEFYYIKRAPDHPLWKQYIDWLNEKYSTRWTGTDYVYYGYDGRCDCHTVSTMFNSNAKEITLEFWDMYMNKSKLPEYATADMISYDTASAARMTTVDHTDPSTGIKSPEPADLRLRTATGNSSGNWPSTRIDGNDPLRMENDTARYVTAFSYATPTSKNDSIYKSLRGMGKSYNHAMNKWIDVQSIQGPTLAQVSIDAAVDNSPKKSSRYSSMLDLI